MNTQTSRSCYVLTPKFHRSWSVPVKVKVARKKLSFARGNAKLDKKVAIFSLPAGHTCPFAMHCQSRADRVTGKIQDGEDTEFRCFAASAEALFKNIRDSRWSNFDLLRACKTTQEMVELICSDLLDLDLQRIHGSGDFWSQRYFDAWLEVARLNPGKIFYGYTKALKFWVARLGRIPANMHLVASKGGTHDHLIKEYGLRKTVVVFSEQEAIDLGLPLDHDDSHVWNYDGDFAMLLHGTQPAGSEASKAYSALKRAGNAGYTGIGEHFRKQREARAMALA